MKKSFKLIFLIVFAGIFVIIVNTLNFKPEDKDTPVAVNIDINSDEVIHRLADVLKFQTISNQDPALFNAQTFAKMQDYLAQAFPLMYSSLDKEVVNQHSLLFKWQGKNTTSMSKCNGLLVLSILTKT